MSVKTVPAGQLDPLDKHTGEPFTKIAEAFKVEPEALVNPSQAVEVTEPTERFEIAPELALIVVPEAVAKPSQTVLVPCPNTAVLAFKLFAVPEVARKLEKVEVPTTVKVEVTVEEAPTKPPYNRRVLVANAPRAVTEANVSVSASRYAGQLRPFVRQTVEPPTVKALKEPVLALMRVVEAIPLTNKFVVVTSTPVASAKVRLLSAEVPVTVSALRMVCPSTVKVEVTVEDAPTNPPKSCKVVVENEPRAVTEAKVSVSASRYAGQLRPLVRQTVEPPTVSALNVPLLAFN